MKKILVHLTMLVAFSLPVQAYAALTSDVDLEKSPGSVIKLEASQRPTYIGIHGGTAPISLMRASNGLLLAFTGQTGNDFILSMRNNASQHNKADLQDSPSPFDATSKKTQNANDSSFVLNDSSKNATQLEKTEANPVNKDGEEAKAQEINNKSNENTSAESKSSEKNPNTEPNAYSANTNTELLASKTNSSKAAPIEEENKEEIKGKNNKTSSNEKKAESPIAEKTEEIPASQGKELLVAEASNEVENSELANSEVTNNNKDLKKNDPAEKKSKSENTDLKVLPAAFKKTQAINSSSVVFAHDAGFEYLDDSTMLPFGLNEMDKPKISIASIEKKTSFKPLVLHDYRPIL